MWGYVGLCVAMCGYVRPGGACHSHLETILLHLFPKVWARRGTRVVGLCGIMWGYVGLCGAMWGYVGREAR
jgi:hypothetical protein